ncbi:hypothetical protein RRG08_028548 [Elysia crispata]|uniref:Uncharacterized protein n=1 Tax=Elysia crispata TaxID=231223 RepID=A0AAE0Y9J5_9GAST|nr:hypothetical protein RRG08_028548 [Elysia crispata]
MKVTKYSQIADGDGPKEKLSKSSVSSSVWSRLFLRFALDQCFPLPSTLEHCEFQNAAQEKEIVLKRRSEGRGEVNKHKCP